MKFGGIIVAWAAAGVITLGFDRAGAQTQTEVRGAWIVAERAAPSVEKVSSTMQRLAKVGLNTVYVDVWRDGWPRFPSNAALALVGEDRSPLLRAANGVDGADANRARDFLEESLIEAQRSGLVYVAAFPDVLGLDAGHPLVKARPDWVCGEVNGREAQGRPGRLHLNPLHPGVRRWVIDCVLEAVDRYDLDGVQFDEGIALVPLKPENDPIARKAYADDHGGKESSPIGDDPEWASWRARKADEFVRMIAQEVRTKRKGLLVSFSPGCGEVGSERRSPDWARWGSWTAIDAVRMDGTVPRIDEFVPRCFTPDFSEFVEEWRANMRAMEERGGVRVPDLRGGLAADGAETGWEGLSRRIALVRSTGAGGFVLHTSAGAERHSEELALRHNVAALGAATHPFFGARWRTPAATTIRAGTDDQTGEAVWSGGAGGGRWRTIAWEGERWRYVGATLFTPGGRVDVRAPISATRVELVRDRREEMAKGRR